MAQRLHYGLDDIASRARRAQRLLIGLGFDGTIVPIDDRPDDIRLPSKVRDLLRAIAADERATLAILSGRESSELARLIDLPGVTYVGNHGLEIVGPHVFFLEPAAAQFREQVQGIREEFETRFLQIPGAIVENKQFSVALHHRTVPSDRQEEFRKAVHSTLADASYPFLLREGRMVYEVRPRSYWNKGHALAWLREQLDETEVLTIYAGDDVSDEESFTAISDAVTIKVGDAAATAAQYFVDGPKDVLTFLQWLRELLASPRAA